MTVRLRAHHLLCMLTYVGKGYSPAFCAGFFKHKNMSAPINRKNHKDVPKTILLTWDLCKRSEERADELDVSYSGYIRNLIAEDLKRVEMERLSQENQSNNSSNPLEILSRLNGLLTSHPELKVLIELMSKK